MTSTTVLATCGVLCIVVLGIVATSIWAPDSLAIALPLYISLGTGLLALLQAAAAHTQAKGANERTLDLHRHIQSLKSLLGSSAEPPPTAPIPPTEAPTEAPTEEATDR